MGTFKDGHTKPIARMIVDGALFAVAKDCATIAANRDPKSTHTDILRGTKACYYGAKEMQGRLRQDYVLTDNAIKIAKEFTVLDCRANHKNPEAVLDCATGAVLFGDVVREDRDRQDDKIKSDMLAGIKRRRKVKSRR